MSHGNLQKVPMALLLLIKFFIHPLNFPTKKTTIKEIFANIVIACHESVGSIGDDSRQLCSDGSIDTALTWRDSKADNINESLVTVNVKNNKTGEVLVQWQPPKKPNGPVLNYRIRTQRSISGNKRTPDILCVSTNEYNKEKGYRLKNLRPGEYTVQLMAISLAGNGSLTNEFNFTVWDIPEDGEINITITVIIIISVLLIVVVAVCMITVKKMKTQAETLYSQNPNYMQTEEWYDIDEWEVSRDNIRLIKELGQGSFGTVWEGQMIRPDKSSVSVAIKTVNIKADFKERIQILKEATTMKVFECHHVVKLMGVVSRGQPALVLMELMAQGDLRNFLRKCRPEETEYTDFYPPTDNQIRQMAGEIADGMAYLADKKIVHRDLAARNCLVAEDLTVKIADFGMARDVYMTDYYRKDQRALLPVRWMAPESLHDGIFTTMSDIWSYGIVLWEMVTLAEQPYQGLSNEEVRRYIMEANTMQAPNRCPLDLYSMMQNCWQYNPKRRPTFKNLIEAQVPFLNSRFHEVSYFFQEVVPHYAGEEFHGPTDRYHEEDERVEVVDDNGQRCSPQINEEEDDNCLDPYLHPSSHLQVDGQGGAQPGEQSPLLLHQGGVQEPFLYPPATLDSFDHTDEEDSDNDIGNPNNPIDASVIPERLKLLPDPSTESRQHPRRQAGGHSVVVSVSPPPEGTDQPDYTVMSPLASHSRDRYPPSSTSTIFAANSTPATPSSTLPVLEVSDAPQGSADDSNPASLEARRLLKNNVLSSKSHVDELASLLASHKSSTSSDPPASDPSTASESGSKESSSSSGSHHFNGPTANGHGPFSHQQTALC